MKYSKDGYKRNSKDKNNPYNIIPSGNITMEDVDFPVLGMDNLGNSKVMMPGANYTFPGNSVFEIPIIAQNGKSIDDQAQRKFLIDWLNSRKATGRFDDQLTEKELNEYIKNIQTVQQLTRDEYETMFPKSTSNASLMGFLHSPDGQYVMDLDEMGKDNPTVHHYHAEPSFLTSFTNMFDGLDSKNAVKVHELTHAMTRSKGSGPLRKMYPDAGFVSYPIEQAIRNIPIGTGDYYDTPSMFDSYEGDPEEILAQLMEYRYNFNVDPNKIFTEKDIPEVIKNVEKQGAAGWFGLDIFTPENIIRLLNEVAAVDPKDNNTMMAQFGFEVPMLSDGGSSKKPNKYTLTYNLLKNYFDRGKLNYGLIKQHPRLLIPGPIRRQYDLYKYMNTADMRGITGRNLIDNVTLPIQKGSSLIQHRGLQNSSEIDDAMKKILADYTINSAPFKFSSFDGKSGYIPQGGFPMVNTGDTRPFFIQDDSYAKLLDEYIKNNKISWKSLDRDKPIELNRAFGSFDVPSYSGGSLQDYIDRLNSGEVFSLGDITSWSIGKPLPQFGSQRFLIKNFPTNRGALVNRPDLNKFLTENQKQSYVETELLLPSDTKFKVTNLIKKSPRLPLEYKKDSRGLIYDPVPQWGTDIELEVQKKGGEKKSKYVKSPFTKGKLSLVNTSSLINKMINQGIFKSEFAMGGQLKLDNGYTVEKHYDKLKDIPYISYSKQPDIEGRVYYDSDSTDVLDDFNIIDVESDLIKKQRKHKRTKDIILKYKNGNNLTPTEKAHLNSLGLL